MRFGTIGRVLLIGIGLALLPRGVAHAQVPLLDTFGGPFGFGADCLYPNDDGSSLAAIDLTPAFPMGLNFFGVTHTSAFVNTNGNISFSAAVPTFTPSAFPIADQPMIAPYWADVDIRGAGGSGSVCRMGATDGVWWVVEPGDLSAGVPGRFIATWDKVGYFLEHDDLQMSFQLVLTAVPECGNVGDFDVDFRYNQCGWTTGDASGGSGGFGGVPAQAGFDAGNRHDFVEIMGSRTAEINSILCTTSNIGTPGLWHFEIRSGSVVCPDAGQVCQADGVGVCGMGHTQCLAGGVTCVADGHMSAERCDGLDNDCNGHVDDGDNLCNNPNDVCAKGVCVPRCFEGGCDTGYSCDDGGVCTEDSCDGVICPDGQRCKHGTCYDACHGVVCPLHQTCSGGVCADLCENVHCDSTTRCENGLCVPLCPCHTCQPGLECTDAGQCEDTPCDSVTCPSGKECFHGDCVDPCIGAICPDGSHCDSTAGGCVPGAPIITADAGPSNPDGSVTTTDGGVVMHMDGSVVGRDSGVMTMGDKKGCSCSVPGSSDRHSMSGLFALFGIASLVTWRNRRRIVRTTTK